MVMYIGPVAPIVALLDSAALQHSLKVPLDA